MPGAVLAAAPAGPNLAVCHRLVVDKAVTRPPHDDLRVPATEFEDQEGCPQHRAE